MNKKFKLLLRVFVFSLIFVASASVARAERCCPDGMTRCDAVSGNDIGACTRDGHFDDQWCGRLSYRGWNPIPYERYTRPSFECTEAGTPVTENLDCEWAPFNNEDSVYNGRPAYCVGGFATEQELRNSSVTFDCVENCGAADPDLLDLINGGYVQQASTGNAEVGVDQNGTYFTCFTGDFDGSIKASIDNCLLDKKIASGIGFFTGIAAAGPNILTIPTTASDFSDAAESLVRECEPTIRATTRGFNQSCEANLQVDINLDTEAGNLETSTDAYAICKDNLQVGSEPYNNCRFCMQEKGIWTAVGCISQDPKSMISKIINIGIGILGGIFLIRVLAAAFTLTTSQGDVKKTSDAKEMLTESVIGVVFVIFSVTILQFIGSDILKIPGFGS